MHQRPADQRHLPEARGAAGRGGADAVVCAGLSGRRFRAIAGRACSPMARPRPMPTPRPIPSRTSSPATRTISTAASSRPTKACACDGAGEDREQADRHRRHPGQSRRRRRFRHHGHAARAGAQQRPARRHRRDLRSRIGARPRMPPASAPPSRWRWAASPAFPATRPTRKPSSSNNCPTENSSRPAPITAAATWTWGPRRAFASAASAWSSPRTRRSSRTRRCTAMSGSSRPSRPSSSTRARCISAPISSRSPKSF